MKFTINTETGSGMKFTTKTAVLHELSLMIDDCIANGGSTFDIVVEANANCFYSETKENEHSN